MKQQQYFSSLLMIVVVQFIILLSFNDISSPITKVGAIAPPTISGLTVDRPLTQYVNATGKSCQWVVSLSIITYTTIQQVSLGSNIATLTDDGHGHPYYFMTVSFAPASDLGYSMDLTFNVTISTNIFTIDYPTTLTCLVQPNTPNALSSYKPYYDPLRKEVILNIVSKDLISTYTDICTGSNCGTSTLIADRIITNSTGTTRERIYELAFTTLASAQTLSFFDQQLNVVMEPLFSSSTAATVDCPTPMSPSIGGYSGGIFMLYCSVYMDSPSVLATTLPSYFMPYQGSILNGTYLLYSYATLPGTIIVSISSLGTSNFTDWAIPYSYTKITNTFSISSFQITNNEMLLVGYPSILVNLNGSKNASPPSLSNSFDMQLPNRILEHDFPFSFGAGTADNYTQTMSILIHQYYQFPQVSLTTIAYQVTQSSTKAYMATTRVDDIKPILVAISYQFLDYNTGIIKMKVEDGESGVYRIKIAGDELTINHLLNGTIYSGWFSKELSLDLFNPIGLISIEDICGNEATYSMGDLFIDENSALQTIPNLYTLLQPTAFDIKNFWYSTSIVNFNGSDSGNLDNHGNYLFFISFDLENPPFDKKRWSPKVLTEGFGMPNQRQVHSGNYYDTYYVRWSIPIGSVDGQSVTFKLINNRITSKLLESINGITISPLIVNNGSNAYTESFGPTLMITTASPVVNIDQGNGGTILWNGQLNGQLFGGEGTIIVTSNVDPLPYKFNINSDNNGAFTFGITISSNCKSQIFTVTRIQVQSVTGIIYVYDYYGGSNTFNPLLGGAQTIQISCTTVVDDLPPILVDWAVTEVVPKYKYNISFAVQEQGVAAISYRHLPVVYALNGAKERLSFISNRLDSNGYLSNYTVSVDLPYGFPLGGGFGLSLYGLVDNRINFNGYSTGDLEALGHKAYFALPDVVNPTISSVDVLVQDTKGNGKITVRGDAFGSPLQLSSVKGLIDCGGGSAPVQVSPLEALPYQIVFRTTRPLTAAQCSIVVQVDSRLSVSANLTVASYSQPTSTGICPSNCNTRGNCTLTGCVCNPPYIGSDCLGQSDNSTQTNIDQTNPNTSFNTSSENTKVTSSISLIEIRELNIDDQPVKYYDLKSEWNTYNMTNDTNVKEVYIYSKTLQGGAATINVTLEYLRVEQSYDFANQSFKVPPQSVKYSLSITNYTFDSNLNQMMLIFNTSVSDDQCTSQEAGYLDSENNLLSWVELSVGQNVLYARFQQNAIIDNRTISIQNVKIDDNQQQSNNTALVGVKLPMFNNYAIIDPDFSLLVTEKNDGQNSCSGSPTSDNKWKVIVIAVVCGVVGAALITLGTIFLIKKYKWSIKEYTIKLKRHH